MSNLSPAPIQNPLAEEGTGLATLPWILFFTNLFTGDTGTSWVPLPVNLTQVGTPTYQAAYFRSGQFIDFEIKIIPGTSTTSTAGSTYFPLPFEVKQDGACLVVGGLSGSGPGMVVAGLNRAYVPAWSAVTVPLTITGRVRAS